MKIGIGYKIPYAKGGHAAPDPGFEYDPIAWCEDDGPNIPTVTGDPGGVFSASPSISGFNTATGAIPANTAAGSYAITYTVNGVSETDTITVSPDVSTAFTYPDSENRFSIFPTQASFTAGIYTFVSSPAGNPNPVFLDGSTSSSNGGINTNSFATGAYTIRFQPNSSCGNPTTTTFNVTQAFQSFEFTIQVSAGDTFTIPTTGSGYSYKVNWGQSTNNYPTNFVGQGNIPTGANYTGSATSPAYSTSGTYTIQIGLTGNTFPRAYFKNATDRLKLKNITKWGEFQWSSFSEAFYLCTNLDISATDTPDLTNCNNFYYTFYNCTSLTGTLSGVNWNWTFPVSNTTFRGMFFRANVFNGDVSNWDTQNVISFRSMFSCYSQSGGVFNRNLNSWNTSNVTTMYDMFQNQTSFNGDIYNWDTSSVTTMSYMFIYCSSFNQDVNTKDYAAGNRLAWDVSSCTGFISMFSAASSFSTSIDRWKIKTTGNAFSMSGMLSNTAYNQALNTSEVTVGQGGYQQTYLAWDVQKVNNFYAMFSGSSFNQSLSNWDTSSVTTMNTMFGSCPFNQPINTQSVTVGSGSNQRTYNAWDVSSVNDTFRMFRSNSVFNQDLSSWNTQSFLNVGEMFYSNGAFDQNISSWDINQVTNFLNFMAGATLSTTNYDALLTAWDAQGAMSYSGTVAFGNSIPSCDNAASNGAFAARASLITKWGGIADKFSQNNTCKPLAGFDYTSNAYCTNGSDVTPTITGTVDQTLPLGGTISDAWSAVVAILPLKLTVRIAAGGGSFDVGKIKAGGTNFTVNWGDNTIQNNLSKPASEIVTHTYTGTGSQVDYTVEINDTADSGVITHVRFDDSATEGKIHDVTQWGTTPWTSFQNFLRVQGTVIPADVTATDTPNLSNCTAMHGMFQGCTSLVNANNSMVNWITGNVANMNNLFTGTTSFNKNLSGWDITGLSSALYIFQGGGLDTANYTDTIVGWAVQVYNNSAQPASINMSGIPASGVFDGSRTTDNASGQAYSAKYSNWPGWSNAQAAYDYLTSTLSWTISAS